jgi:hypothetical protein
MGQMPYSIINDLSTKKVDIIVRKLVAMFPIARREL